MPQDFDQYIRQGEPSQQAKAYAWQTAIGLQDVDGLQVSNYLKETARSHIEGRIDIGSAQERIEAYYRTHTADAATRTEEADKVSARITSLLDEDAFSFRPTALAAIHRRLFTGVFKHAGEYRTFNVSKREWVLDGKSVIYAPFEDIAETLAYDFSQEQAFDYTALTRTVNQLAASEAIAAHLAAFIAGIWQVHPFSEGNTRTTAVFTIKYLRCLGYNDLTNAPFARHARYFRDALVRANYSDLKTGVKPTLRPLADFLAAAIDGTPPSDDRFQSRHLHISAAQ